MPAVAPEAPDVRATAPPTRAAWAEQHPLLTVYYDVEWGMPVTDETGVFERLSLEAFQSGLSWLTILQRREGFRDAFAGFDPERVAAFGEADVERLLADAGIIRNRRKILATIGNARATLALRDQGTDLARLVWGFRPERSPAPRNDAEVGSASAESLELARELKRRGFAFVGPTTVYALMTAIGIVDEHLVSSHRRGCSGLWNADGSRTARAVPFPELAGAAAAGSAR
ncbi:DNA-3-methyladenine glycosylase I [Leucobacter allii]|uniref:DNA-3-methyladenine glycosylase I n=1 Tax=Leucobacter allii TaxID=2932247 RepID=A0ABY4FGG2_9MICO|nr:DNA-3-methyladenine glycosylase I [Leucobacter allii]UOQ55765.1 DNA-3-methyladenine glycosylase I [Leucobacter allii]UOR00280.1 DNA-3-methyladenine glycosylase I [Leucobacter allii]